MLTTLLREKARGGFSDAAKSAFLLHYIKAVLDWLKYTVQDC